MGHGAKGRGAHTLANVAGCSPCGLNPVTDGSAPPCRTLPYAPCRTVLQEGGSTHLTISTYQRWSFGDLAEAVIKVGKGGVWGEQSTSNARCGSGSSSLSTVVW